MNSVIAVLLCGRPVNGRRKSYRDSGDASLAVSLSLASQNNPFCLLSLSEISISLSGTLMAELRLPSKPSERVLLPFCKKKKSLLSRRLSCLCTSPAKKGIASDEKIPILSILG